MRLDRPPLNVWPIGLLDAFSVKNGGQYPQDMPPTLQPVLSLEQWYSESNAVDYSLTTAVLNANTNFSAIAWTGAATLPLTGGFVTVPETEIWHLSWYSAFWTFNNVAGGDFGTPALCLTNQLNQITVLGTGVTGHTTSSATISRGGAASLQRPVFARPGDRLGLLQGGYVNGGGTLTIFGYVRMRRFRI